MQCPCRILIIKSNHEALMHLHMKYLDTWDKANISSQLGITKNIVLHSQQRIGLRYHLETV